MNGTLSSPFPRSRREKLLIDARYRIEKLRQSFDQGDGDMMIQITLLRDRITESISRGSEEVGFEAVLEEIGSSQREFNHLLREERLRYARVCLKQLREGRKDIKTLITRIRNAVDQAGTHLFAVGTDEDEITRYENPVPVPELAVGSFILIPETSEEESEEQVEEQEVSTSPSLVDEPVVEFKLPNRPEEQLEETSRPSVSTFSDFEPEVINDFNPLDTVQEAVGFEQRETLIFPKKI